MRPPREALTADKRVSTPLGSFVVPHAVLADHDAEIRYCYTQLGLKYDHDLHGTLTLRLEVDSDGGIRDVVITQRSWQGITAGEVEACVRALVRDWTLPHGDPAISAGSKELTLTFAP